MLVKAAEKIKNVYIKRFVQHLAYLALLFIFIPGFYYFEICIVLPTVAEEWTFTYTLHILCSTFLLSNILGNLIYGMFTNTSIKGKFLTAANKENWTFCSECDCLRPPRAWHCDICNICVLKRDHHCTFFATCVGYTNYRFFILFTFYIFIAMVYALYFNIKFLVQFVSWKNGLIILQIVFPLANLIVDFSLDSLCLFLVTFNVVIVIFSGFLVYYHFENIFKGKTTPERKLSSKEIIIYNNCWKSNLIEVLGSRWYLTWISPFIQSPLPGNGMEWLTDNKYN